MKYHMEKAHPNQKYESPLNKEGTYYYNGIDYPNSKFSYRDFKERNQGGRKK
jgi:hypothetical protein